KISRRHAFRQVVRGGVDVVNRPVAARARWRIRVFDDQREALRIFGRALPKKRRRLVLALLGKAFRHRRAIWKRAAGKGECHRKPRWIVTLKLRTGSPVPWCLGRFKRHFGCAEPCRPPGVGPKDPKTLEVIEEAPLGQFKMAQWREKSERDASHTVYYDARALQCEIILRKPWQRMVFAAALIIPFVLLFIGW